MRIGKYFINFLARTNGYPVFRSPSLTTFSTKSDNQHATLSYQIDKSTFSPFMTSPKLFIDRLQIYLRDTFAVKFEMKSRPSQQVIYELNGQSQDIRKAQAELTSLFSSVTTKLYSKHIHCKFSSFQYEFLKRRGSFQHLSLPVPICTMWFNGSSINLLSLPRAAS